MREELKEVKTAYETNMRLQTEESEKLVSELREEISAMKQSAQDNASLKNSIEEQKNKLIEKLNGEIENLQKAKK